jgi:hypothetical protein
MGRFLTYTKKSNRVLILAAAKESNFDIYTAFHDSNPDNVAVYTNETCGKEHWPFWDVFDKMKKELEETKKEEQYKINIERISDLFNERRAEK